MIGMLKAFLRKTKIIKIFHWFKMKGDLYLDNLPEKLCWKLSNKACVESSMSKDSLDHPVRAFLIERIKHYGELASIMEVGCGTGVNLALLRKCYPKAKLCGIDINKKAIRCGNRFFKEKKDENINLYLKEADDLSLFETNSFQVVFTNACLIHIGPNEVFDVLKGMLRIASKAVVLVEFFSPKNEFYMYDYRWYYNWPNILSSFDGIDASLEKIPPDLCASPWDEYGYMIIVELR